MGLIKFTKELSVLLIGKNQYGQELRHEYKTGGSVIGESMRIETQVLPYIDSIYPGYKWEYHVDVID